MNKAITKIKYIVFTGIVFPFISKAYDFLEDSGLNNTANRAGYPEKLNTTPENLVVQGINLVLSFVGVLFLILTIVSGFRWMTARGNETEVEKAKTTLTRSVIGLIIVFGAYAISYFIVSYFAQGTLAS